MSIILPGNTSRPRVFVTYADANEELVEVDVTIAVGVEKSHEGGGLGAGDVADADLAETRPELLSVDLVVSIERVEVTEGSSETSDGLSTSGLDLRSDSLKDCKHKQRLTVQCVTKAPATLGLPSACHLLASKRSGPQP